MIQKLFIVYYYIYYKYFVRFKSRAKLERWQHKKILHHLNNINRKSKFYRELWKDSNLENYNNLPIITKKEMMENFDILVTIPIKKEEAFRQAISAEKSRNLLNIKNKYTIGLSSGTSGNRGLFVASKQERFKWAGAILAKLLPRGLFKRYKIAFFLRANSNLYETVKSSLISFRYFDMMLDIEEHVKSLNEFLPDILIAPPSVLRQLTTAKQANALEIQPEKIVSVAEVLENIDKKLIEETFAIKIDQVYQATEGFLATTCKFGKLHLNEDILMIQKQYLDEKSGRFIPIITDFTRSSQPIIRYQLNDVLIENKENCLCESPFTVIEKIEGRQNDIFLLRSLKNKNEFKQIYPDFINRAMIFASDKIENYRVVQIDFDNIIIYLETNLNVNLSKEIKQSFGQMFKKMGCECPNIKIKEYEEIKGKKLKRVENKFKI